MGGLAEDRKSLIAEGIDFGRRHGIERAGLSYLYTQRLLDEFWRGDWDAALVTSGGIDDAQPVFRVALWVRSYIELLRQGANAAMPPLSRLREMVRAQLAGSVFDAMAVAASVHAAGAYVLAGRVDVAKELLAHLRGSLSRQAAGEGPSPRSALGNAGVRPLSVAALATNEPDWLDAAESEVRRAAPSAAVHLSVIHAARAILASDAPAAGRELAGQLDLAESLGFALTAIALGALAREAIGRGLRLGPEWDEPLARMRAFFVKADARWWLAELDRVEAAR